MSKEVFSWEVTSYTDEEAKQVCEEHMQSPCVVSADPVTFAGKTHVHLGLDDGDFVVVSKSVCLHVEG